MGKKQAKKSVLETIERARKAAAQASKGAYKPTKRKGRSLATRLASKVKGDAFYTNVLQSVPGLIKLAARGRETLQKSRAGLGKTLPGTKYVGPGNPMDLGLPLTDGDALAYEHDMAYGRLLDHGVPPAIVYAGLTQADNDAIRSARNLLKIHPDPTALAVYLGLGLKRGASRLVVDALGTIPAPIRRKLDLEAIREFYPDNVVANK